MARLIILLCLCFLTVGPAFCWWETGHRTVARIAARHLTPAARSRLARIFNVADSADAVADALAVASTWADETKSQTQTGPWHYIDLALQDSRSDFAKRCEHDDCAPARIRIFAAQLSAKEKDRSWSEVDAVRYIVHLVGDIHQPLHAISDADLGGNCELLNPPFNDAKNLHALWDGGIIREMSIDDRALAVDLDPSIAQLSTTSPATSVPANPTNAVAAQPDLTKGDQDDWTWESHLLAQKVIYGRLHIPTEPVIFPKGCPNAPIEIREFVPQIDGVYINDMKPVIRRQLLLGGLRLARVLNDSL